MKNRTGVISFLIMWLPRHLFLGLVVTHATAAADDDNVAKWTVKGGFIPGTKDDVETGFMTVAAAKKRCEQLSKCVAITFHAKADVDTEVHVYLKQDSTVSETDKAWTSMVKRPAGLMDVIFMNELAFPLELCWIDLVGSVPPICYGTVQPGSSKNLSSYAGHNFVLKRLVWSLTAPAAALATAASASADPQVARLLAALDSEGDESGGGGGGAGPIAITARQRAYEWESPLALTGGGGAEVAHMEFVTTNAAASATPAVTTRASVAVELINQLPQPAEVCTVPRWASRLLQASMPEGLEKCHGVAAAGGKLTVSGVDVESVLLARQLVGVTTITKGVINYSLTQQQLSADLMRRMVRAMDVGGAGTPLPPVRGTPPPPAKPPPVRPHRPPGTPPRPPPGSPDAGGGGGGIGAAVAPTEWVPLLGTAATGPASLRGRCPGIYAGERTASVAASASALLPRMLAAALGRPLPPPSCDDKSCLALAATAGVPLDAGDAGAAAALAPSVARTLRMLREQAPHLARAAGAAPLVLLASVSAPGASGAGAVGHTGTAEAAEAARGAASSDGLDASTVPPLLATLSLALGGVRSVQLQLLRAAGDAAAADELAAAATVWECALGIELSVFIRSSASAATAEAPRLTRVAMNDRGAQVTATDATPMGIISEARLVLAGTRAAPWWEAVAAYGADDAIVIGARIIDTDGGARGGLGDARVGALHTFVSSRPHALGMGLGDDTFSALEAVVCSACELSAVALLQAGCDVSAPAVQSLMWATGASSVPWARVFDLVYEIAAGWPLGYRLADRCAALAEFLGSGDDLGEAAADAVRATGASGASLQDGVSLMCRAHGCT